MMKSFRFVLAAAIVVAILHAGQAYAAEILSMVSIRDVQPFPEPGSMMLFGTALFAVAGVARRRLR